jgi:hypothetical protein
MTPPNKGTVTGVFVNITQYETGPVDPTQICTESQLGSCRVTLVR